MRHKRRRQNFGFTPVGGTRFGKTKYLYVIYSDIKFKHHGLQHQRTYYGSNSLIPLHILRERATRNINKKFLKSSGRLLKLSIHRK